jgi:hypothetical protein
MRLHVTTAHSGNNIVTSNRRPVGNDIDSRVLVINCLLANTLIQGREPRQLQVGTRKSASSTSVQGTWRRNRVQLQVGTRKGASFYECTRYLDAAIVLLERAQSINDTNG